MHIARVLAIALLLPAFAFAAQRVNINTADAALLDTLPGIGPSKAAAIVDYRTKHGAFKRIEDIQNVSGIGPVTFKNLETMITVGASAAATVTEPLTQPSPPPVSYTKVQAPRPVIRTNQNPPAHDEAISAPTAVVEPAAVGAVPYPTSRSSGLLHSVWTYGLIGVIVLAGSAFVFL